MTDANLDTKRVLMIAATPFFSDRGCHIRIAHEMRQLQRLGKEVSLVAYGLGDEVPGILVKRSFRAPWYHKRAPGPSWHKVYLDPLLVLTSARECARIRPDVIHAHLYEGLVVAWFARGLVSAFAWKKSAARPPIIFDCQGGLAAEMYEYALKRLPFARLWCGLFSIIERAILIMPDAIVCSSEQSKELLVRSYGISENSIRVVRDGYSSDNNARSGHVALDVPTGNSVLMYTGSMTSAKGVGRLLDAVPALLEKMPRATFVFAGFGDLVDIYREKYSDLISTKKVLILGKVAYGDIPALLAVADLAIDPKFGSTESSGKLMDYISAGVPTVCLDQRAAGMPGVECIADFMEIPAALERARNHAKKGRSSNEHKVVDSSYSWNVIISELLAAYADTLSSMRRAPRRSKTYAYIMGFVIASAFLLLFFRYSSPVEVFHYIAAADLRLVALSLCIYAAIYGLRAFRLSRISPVKGFIDNLILVSFHMSFGAALPARLGEASYPFLLKKIHGVSYGKSVSDLVHIRVLDALNVALVAPVMIAYFEHVFSLSSAVALTVLGEGVIIVIMRYAGAFARYLPKKLGMHTVTDWRTIVATSSISFVLSFCMIAFGVALMSAFHITDSPVVLIIGSALGLFVGALPIQGLFGIGGIEAGWIVPLKAFGATGAASFTASVGYHVINLFFTFLFGALAWALFSVRTRIHSRLDR